MSAIQNFNIPSFLNKDLQTQQKEFNKLPNERLLWSDRAPERPEYSIAGHPDNMGRNRYPNILANNQTYVRLEGRTDDYINADYCLNKRVIISQGPKADGDGYAHHHADFYHMLFTNNCSAIFMMTNYIEKTIENGVEKSFEKCSCYLPLNDEIKRAGQYSITAKENHEFAALANLGIKVTNVFITKDQEMKTLRHFHYPNWEDGSGGTAEVVAPIVRQLIQEITPVVHCSAGIGRAGTTVATASAYLKILNGEITENLVPQTVTDLRSERRGCVQNEEQYSLLYDTLKILVTEDQKTEIK